MTQKDQNTQVTTTTISEKISKEIWVAPKMEVISCKETANKNFGGSDHQTFFS